MSDTESKGFPPQGQWVLQDHGLGLWQPQFDVVTITLAPIRKVALEMQKAGVLTRIVISPDEARHLARILNATADKADPPAA